MTEAAAMQQVPHLLVVNPNTTAAITELAMTHVRAAVGDRARLTAVTGRFGCAYISSEACFAVAGHAALDCVAPFVGQCDGVLLACFGDPGLFALREVFPGSVTGLAEACMVSAAARVERFAIVTGGVRWPPMLRRLAGELGVAGKLADIRTVELTGAQIAADPAAAMDRLAAECNAAAQAGAQEIILGGAGLAGIAAQLQPRCSVPLRDSVLVGTQVALERMHAPGDRRAASFACVPSGGVSPELAKLLT